MVRWDLSAQYGREVLTDADCINSRPAFLLMDEAQEDLKPFNPNELKTSEIRKRVLKLDPESLHRVLLPEQPVNAHELLAIKVSDTHRMLIYLIDKSQVEYDLAMVYANSQSCDRNLLEAFATSKRVTVEKAKVLWARQQLTEQSVFVRETVERIHEKNGKTLEDVFSMTLGLNMYQAVLADWVPLSSMKVMDVKEIKKPLLRQEIESAKKRLDLPGRGRRKRTGKEFNELQASREHLIKDAMMKLCDDAMKADENAVAAEDLLTPAAIAEEMGKHVSTLYKWLGTYNLDFDDIKSLCLRRTAFRA